jgi:hypothetical protein
MRTSDSKRRRHPAIKAALLIASLLLASSALAALPKPTPAQQQAAAEKKAKADAQAAKDKESLAASMDAVSAHWRTRATQEGWKAHPAVAIAAAAPAANPPVKSEKFGTAPPSEDVKAHPTRAQPKDIAPTVQKGSPENVSRK